MYILVVDDEPIIMEGIRETVRRVCPEADIAGFDDPENALEYAAKHPVDVAFLDVEMPALNGLMLGKAIKKAHHRVNIVFVTSYRDYAVEAMASDGVHASGYLMKPVTAEAVRREMQDLRYPVGGEKRLKILTFGNFEAMCSDVPIRFEYQKTKELLAYLIDRNGAMCTNGEVQAILWESDKSEALQKNYLKQIRKDLLDSLRKVGCESAVVQQRGQIGIRVSEVDCDYYRYRAGEEGPPYCGEYMSQYSWAEMTHAWLDMQEGRKK